MAVFPIQAESISANPAPLSLHSAALALEDISDDLADLSALVWLASQADTLEANAGKALRAIMARLDSMAAAAGRQSEAFLEARGSSRAASQ